MTERPFDAVHAGWRSQLAGGPLEVCDSGEIVALRGREDYDSLLALSAALSRQLRYREATEVCAQALSLRPDDPKALRLRAGKYLSTLQCARAKADFLRCLALSGEEVDLTYRLGLCDYFAGAYKEAAARLEQCFVACDDEMGIAAMYWHTLSSSRADGEPILLPHYHEHMDVGHHTAYEKAVRVWAGRQDCRDALALLERERDDLEYGITAYGLCAYLRQQGDKQTADALQSRILQRDGFWPSFAYLAAWNDMP